MVFGFPGITATALISSRLATFVELFSTVTASMCSPCLFVSKLAGRLHPFAALFNQLGNEGRPAGLVAGANACTVVAMKVLVEVDQVAPVRILLEFLQASVHGAGSIRGAKKNPGKAARDFRSGLPERGAISRAGRQLRGEDVAVEVVKFLQGLDEQKIDGKPDRPAPI